LVDVALRGRSRRTAGRLADAAIRYAATGWPVCTGAFAPSRLHRSAARSRSCSCDRIGCPAPGAHPLWPAWQSLASTDPELVAGWWLATPEANVVLVTGRVFDVLDVPAAVGLAALARMERSGLRPGPVAIGCEDRAHFYVRTRGTPDDENEWWSCRLDCKPEEVAEVSGLRWHCRDSYVLAPPSRHGDRWAARWLREPAAYQLPDGVQMLETLAEVCEEIGS
jgi:Bifunctional DNA primase/polymerase, N-terminal